jgi:hypothetical protein
MASELQHRLTVQDYLALERAVETRSEYLDATVRSRRSPRSS